MEESKHVFWYRRKQEKKKDKKDERKESQHVIYVKAIKMLSIIWQNNGLENVSIHSLDFSLGILEVIIT